MKKYITMGGIFLSLFSYGQESVFKTINQENIGVFSATGQSFFIHRSERPNINFDNINSTSLAFTLNYESPRVKNFSLNFSYIQSILIQEDGYTTSGVPATDLQNNSFNTINNVALNYHLNALKLEESIVSIGRLPLDTEFMTTYQIRQKEQAYEGVLLGIHNVKNWSIKLGYLTKFSSWRSNPSDFSSISKAYDSVEDIDDGQEFVEVVYNAPKANTRIALYYVLANNVLNTTGVYYGKELFSNDSYKIVFKGKGIVQWGTLYSSFGENALYGIQPGVLTSFDNLNVETGLFLTRGTIGENTSLQNPFGAKLIPSEPLIGTSATLNNGSTSYYVESSYRFPKGRLYALYLRTKDTSQNTYDEWNLIGSFQINKKLTPSFKIGFLNENISNNNSHILDVRLVLNYTF